MGAWFTPPVDYDEMAERIGLNDRYEEYAIHDYELPFEIDEYTPIEEVNRLLKWWRTYQKTYRTNYRNC